jgi:hypothetical protein
MGVRSSDSQAPNVGFVPLRDGWVLPTSPAEGKPEQGAKSHDPQTQSQSHCIATLGVDIGKNTFHLVGLDKGGAIVLHGLRKTAARRLAEAGCTASDRSRTAALRP